MLIARDGIVYNNLSQDEKSEALIFAGYEKKIDYEITSQEGNVWRVKFRWQKFNEESQEYGDVESDETISFEIAGNEGKIAPGEVLEIEIEEPGTHVVKTTNVMTSNCEVVLHV